MSKIKEAFKNKAFIGFLTAGDPDMESSEKYILDMIRAGADLIEIGIPFSDPVAEGEVIQAATLRALKSGTTVDKVFSLVESLRKKTDVPFVFLTYLNPVFNYGPAIHVLIFFHCSAGRRFGRRYFGICLPGNSAGNFAASLPSQTAVTGKHPRLYFYEKPLDIRTVFRYNSYC